MTHPPFLVEKLLTLQEEPLFFFEIAEKESSGCFCLPVVSFSSLLIVKNRKPDLTWLKEKGNLLAHVIKKEWRDTRARPMSSRPALSASLISGFVCQTSLLGSRWWHLEELENLPSTNPKGNSRESSPCLLERSWSSLWSNWLRSWVLPEPATGPERCCALIGLSDSHFPPLETWNLPPSTCSRNRRRGAAWLNMRCCNRKKGEWELGGKSLVLRKLGSVFTVLKDFLLTTLSVMRWGCVLPRRLTLDLFLYNTCAFKIHTFVDESTQEETKEEMIRSQCNYGGPHCTCCLRQFNKVHIKVMESSHSLENTKTTVLPL